MEGKRQSNCIIWEPDEIQKNSKMIRKIVEKWIEATTVIKQENEQRIEVKGML